MLDRSALALSDSTSCVFTLATTEIVEILAEKASKGEQRICKREGMILQNSKPVSLVQQDLTLEGFHVPLTSWNLFSIAPAADCPKVGQHRGVGLSLLTNTVMKVCLY